MYRKLLCMAVATGMIWFLAAAAQEKGPFMADRHKAQKISCDGCHKEAAPTTPALAEACLKCHTSLEAVAEKTTNLKPNPHKNHLTEGSDVECTQCHQGHKPNAVICSQCHGEMQFEKQPEAK